jgi:hypothetical protein
MTDKAQGAAAADDQWIFDLAVQHELRGNGMWGDVTFNSTGLVEFVRAALKAQPAPCDRDAVLEEAAMACESWGNEKVAKWADDPEISEDAKARAWDGLQCAATIRKLKAQPAPTEAQGDPVAYRHHLPEGQAFGDGKTTQLFDNFGDAWDDWMLHGGILEALHGKSRAPTGAAQGEDSARLDALLHASWNLECFNMPTGGGDYEIGWRVFEHHESAPLKRTVAEVYEDNPRAAIDRARASAETGGVK